MGVAKPTRHELALGDPPLYVLVDPPQVYGGDLTSPGARYVAKGASFRVLHVIVPARGCEMRGYILSGKVAHVRRPANPPEWPEVDAEVERVLGVSVVAKAVA